MGRSHKKQINRYLCFGEQIGFEGLLFITFNGWYIAYIAPFPYITMNWWINQVLKTLKIYIPISNPLYTCFHIATNQQPMTYYSKIR